MSVRIIEEMLDQWQFTQVIVTKRNVPVLKDNDPAVEAFALHGPRCDYATPHYALCSTRVYRDAAWDIRHFSNQHEPLMMGGVMILHCPELPEPSCIIVTRFP